MITTRKFSDIFHIRKKSVFVLMILSNLLYSIQMVTAKILYQNVNFIDGTILIALGTMMTTPFLFLMKKPREAFMEDFSKIRNQKNALFFMLFVLPALLLYYLAIAKGPVPMVSVLEGFQMVFLLIAATILSLKYPEILKEETTLRTLGIKSLAILLMFLGLILLNL